MLNSIKEGKVTIQGNSMSYLEFGKGDYPLVILPGLGDGLATVSGQKFNLAFYFRKYLPHFRVYVFSRKDNIETNYSTKDMARDQMLALQQLGIKRTFLMGVSQGGMIAQHFAIDYPEMVSKLVLAVTSARPNPTLQKVVAGWIEMAEKNDYKSLAIDTIEKSYSSQKLAKYRPLYPILSRVGKPESFQRFIIQAKACLSHNSYDQLSYITCPTLVIGGDSDKVVGSNSSEEISRKIADSKLLIYNMLGHGTYEEARDFSKKVSDFLLND